VASSSSSVFMSSSLLRRHHCFKRIFFIINVLVHVNAFLPTSHNLPIRCRSLGIGPSIKILEGRAQCPRNPAIFNPSCKLGSDDSSRETSGISTGNTKPAETHGRLLGSRRLAAAREVNLALTRYALKISAHVSEKCFLVSFWIFTSVLAGNTQEN
jgi:hypothetical protein